MTINGLTAKVRHLLTGEPLRAINYGAVVVVYLVVNLLQATGHIRVAPDFNAIVVAVGAAVAAVTEAARRFVYSPNTVDDIVNEDLS